MKKNKIFAVLASSTMILSLLAMPVTVNAAGNSSPQYLTKASNKKTDTSGKIIYEGEFFANGTPITIEATTTPNKTALIKWAGGSQEIDSDDAVYGGSDSTSNDVELESTSITMNGGTVKLLIAGNKMTNETKCKKSTIKTATVDINGGTISQGLSGIDNQNTVFGPSVMENNLYKNYSIDTLNVTIDGAKVADFRGVTSYAYTNNMNVTLGKDKTAELGNMIWGTNGVINNANFTMYGGKTQVASSIYRSQIQTKMTYNFLGGEVGDIYAGSYYPELETAAGTNNWKGWGAGNIDYGFANAVEINIAEGVVYKDIISGFQSRKDDISSFKSKFPSELWRIADLKENTPIVMNLASKQTSSTLDKYSVIDSKESNIKTNWLATGISLDKKTATLDVGNTITLVATVTPTNVSNKTVNWSSNDTKIATVDTTGKVTAVAAGTATITAKSGNKTATCVVTVKKVADIPTIDTTKPVEKVEIGIQDKASQEIVNNSVTSIVDDIKVGSTVSEKTMSKATVDAVKKALTEGKEITSKVEAKTIEVNAVEKATVSKVEELVTKLEKAGNTKATIAQFLDLSVLLMADNTKLGTLNELSKPIEFTIAMPEDLQKDGRKYYVVRVHEGVAEKLETILNEDGSITFKTDKFSTYALVYEDVTTPSNKDEVIKTSDEMQIVAYAVLTLSALAALILLKKKNYSK
ncbi:MAG: Ig-like domain-containing protein [Coprobacillus sp.]